MNWFKRLKNLILPWKGKKDYCTMWPDVNYSDCCHQHDDDYKYGEISKNEADLYLRECVIASGHPKIAQAMYLGVTIGAWIPWWNHRRRNLKRPDNEKEKLA